LRAATSPTLERRAYGSAVIRWRSAVVRSHTGSWGGARGVVTIEAVLDTAVDLASDAGPDAGPGVGVEPAVGAGVDGGPQAGVEAGVGDATVVAALAYAEVTGIPEVGERVLLTTAQYDAGLGTGGWALVAARPDAVGPTLTVGTGPDTGRDTGSDSGGSWAGGRPGPVAGRTGHLVKDRYSPLQQAVAGADEQGSPWHAVLADADDLGGLPVVVADLHSALPAVLAGIRAQRPGTRVVYVMSDGGALPLAYSRTVAGLVAAGWLAATVTAGQAWGGDLEAVTVHSALLAARVAAGAEVVVVSQGPGNLGTGTRFGFSGIAAGEAVNAAVLLGGRAVAALRVSGADPRSRHHGVSHHSLTAYGRVATAVADVVVAQLPGDLGELVRSQAAVLAAAPARHRLVAESVTGLDEALDACPVPLESMGRPRGADPAAWLSAAAAGRHAARLVAG